MYGVLASIALGLQPSNLAAILAALGLLALLFRWRILGRRLLVASALVIVLFGLIPGGQLILYPLEERFVRPDEAAVAEAAGIIVLGGAEKPYLTSVRNEPALSDNALRLVAAADLANRYPEKPLYYTGGIAAENGTDEADVAALAFAWMGLAPERVTLERESRNTHTNATETRKLIEPGDAPWILVTSAYHMPRAVGAFRAAGWNVVPYPVGYRTRPSGRLSNRPVDVATRLREADLAVHEWMGLAIYRLRGWTDAFFPAAAP